jgi:eukaryotic-like serine/threonine-protein kinase
MENSDNRAERTTGASDSWRRVKLIVGGALDRSGAERDRYVAEACAADGVLRTEVVSLLEATLAAEHHFERPAGARPIDPMSVIEVGRSAGPYRLVRPLGSGGMGIVYLAERADGNFEQRVAIKVVRQHTGTPFLLERFREERRILATLEHPNIARLIDGGTTESGLPYVAMEYVEGEPIDVFCRTHRLTLRQRLELFRQVCAAVHYAHQHLVVHRDIKAGNILVTGDGVPKLLDFGIAKLTQTNLADDHAVTLYRLVTPDSASPEQLQGKPIAVAADVYALGVLLFRLLTGQSPYGGEPASETELIRAVCERPPDVPSLAARRAAVDGGVAVAQIPADVDAIVLKALRKEPERRYGSVDQFSEDIRRHLEGRPVSAAPDTLVYRVGKFVRRHRVAVLAAAVAVIAVSAGVASTVWQAQVARAERARAERQFAAVRTLAGSVLGELYDSVRALPNSLAARELLLRRATEYLDALATESGSNVDLRLEVVNGYLRLGQLQGVPGLENLGDRGAATRTFDKAAAVLDPVVRSRPAQDSRATLLLADILLQLEGLERATSDGQRLQRARQLIETLPADVRGSTWALGLETKLWHEFANRHVAAKDYPKARDAYTNELRAAETSFRLAPDDLNGSRNLSLACKQLGAVLEMLNADADARALYDRALALDRARVERAPSTGIFRLDLSFSLGSIGALLQSQGDLTGALTHYVQAVELREAVVAAEPRDDFARGSLARGYERLGTIQGRRGELTAALEWHRRRAQLYLTHLRAQPGDDRAWREYTQAAFGSAVWSLDLIETLKDPGTRRAHAARLAEMFGELTTTRARWMAERRSGGLPPSEAEMRQAADRLHRLKR